MTDAELKPTVAQVARLAARINGACVGENGAIAIAALVTVLLVTRESAPLVVLAAAPPTLLDQLEQFAAALVAAHAQAYSAQGKPRAH